MRDNKRREFLLKELEIIYNHMFLFTSMRMKILAATLTILGLIITLGKNSKFPELLGIYMMILLTVFASTRITVSIIRGSYVFFERIRLIENELGEIGQAAIWINYFKKNSKDSGAYASIIAIRLTNWIAFLYVTIGGLSKLEGAKVFFEIVGLAFIICVSLLVLILNDLHIHRKLTPKKFVDNIINSYREAYEKTVEESPYAKKKRLPGKKVK